MPKGLQQFDRGEQPIPSLIPWATGRFYDGFPWGGVVTAAANFGNIWTTYPIWVPKTIALASIAVQVDTAAAAGKVLRLGIYDNLDDEDMPQPRNLLLDSGSLAADSSGLKSVATTIVLRQGLNWLSFVSNGSPIVGIFAAPLARWLGGGHRDVLTATWGYYYYSLNTHVAVEGFPKQFPLLPTTGANMVMDNGGNCVRVMLGV